MNRELFRTWSRNCVTRFPLLYALENDVSLLSSLKVLSSKTKSTFLLSAETESFRLKTFADVETFSLHLTSKLFVKDSQFWFELNSMNISIVLMKTVKNSQKPLYNWEIWTILTPSWFRGVAEEPTRGQYSPFSELYNGFCEFLTVFH